MILSVPTYVDNNAIVRLGQILTTVHTLRSNTDILVSNIIQRTDGGGVYYANVQTYYNPFIPGLVYQHILAGEHVQFVDLASQISGPDLSSDGVHPTQNTYDRMADIWYDALIHGQAFFTGAAGQAWNATSGSTTSFDMDYARTTDAGVAPTTNTDVYFNGGGSGLTTLGQNFTVRSVNFTAGQTAGITVGGGNTLTIGGFGITVQAGTGSHVISSAVALGAGQTWSNVSSNSFAVSGNISGAGPLTIGGSGAIVFSGNNSYTGGTTLGSGTLVANNSSGSATGSGALNIAAGATLAGSGTISGTTTNLGTIAPSAASSSATRLTFTGALTNSATVALELYTSTTNDSLSVSSLTVGSGKVVVSSSGAFTYASGETWDLLDWSSKAGTLSLSNVTLPTLGSGFTWNTSQLDSSGVITIATTPEPASGAVVALGAGLLLRRRRRRAKAE